MMRARVATAALATMLTLAGAGAVAAADQGHAPRFDPPVTTTMPTTATPPPTTPPITTPPITTPPFTTPPSTTPPVTTPPPTTPPVTTPPPTTPPPPTTTSPPETTTPAEATTAAPDPSPTASATQSPVIILGATQVMAGSDLRVTVTGLAGHDEIEVGIASTYVRLATVAVADSTAVVTVRIPADMQPGTHMIQVRADGVALASAELLVLAPSDALAETGSASRAAFAVVLGLVVLGVVLLIARRRAVLLSASVR